jgi:C6 transcription factor Pro1
MCEACAALEIDCLYSDEKPEWMDNGPLQKEKADWLKQDVKRKAARRRERRYLQALELGIETLDVSHADDSDPGNGALHEVDEGMDRASVSLPAATAPYSSPSSTSSKPGSSPQSSGHQDDRSALSAITSPTAPSPEAPELPSSSTIADWDQNTVVLYLDYVFPFLFPYYQPALLDAGRGWLLVLFNRNKALLHTVLSVSSYFFHVVLDHTNCTQSEPCKTHSNTELSKQQALAIQELQIEMQRIVAHGVKGYLVETTRVMASIIQLLTFEVAIADGNNWVMHLDASTELFSMIVREHGDVPGMNATCFISLMVQLGSRPFSYTPKNHPWSADQASLRFSVAQLLFADTLAATALEQPPRLMHHHQSLLTEPDEDMRKSFPDTDREYLFPHIDLTEFIGIPNWVIISIGEIAALDSWKKGMKRSGSLSVAQLVHRASVIEQSLRNNMAAQEIADRRELDSTRIRDPLLDLVSRPGLYPREFSTASSSHWRVWAQAVLTYLNAVVSGWQPSNPEIRNSVATTIQTLLNFPSPSCLRGVIWPITVTGCMANPEEEQTFRDLIGALGPLRRFGTSLKALAIMENTWANRANNEDNADQWDFAACFRSLGQPALLF